LLWVCLDAPIDAADGFRCGGKRELVQERAMPMSQPHEPTQAPLWADCRILPWTAPLTWLSAGWGDYWRAPGLSFIYGALITVLSAMVSWFAWSLGRFALLSLLLSGFVFVAPLLAVGLYSVSRDLGNQMQPRLQRSFELARRLIGQAGVLTLLLLVVLLVWSRAGMLLYALMPVQAGDRGALLELLAVGSAVGALFASFVFAMVAFSLPMIADRGVDMVTACLSSIHAVLRNKLAAMVWAGAIVVLIALGVLLGLVGLIVVMPWLAYATWHGYLAVLDPTPWPRLQ
jgi:uncharacterized membrane protein